MKLNQFRALARDQRGLSTVEYTILLVLIVASTVTLWNDLGEAVVGKLGNAVGVFDDEVKPVGDEGGGLFGGLGL
jgi:Flp pilus assembly pilin Flp